MVPIYLRLLLRAHEYIRKRICLRNELLFWSNNKQKIIEQGSKGYKKSIAILGETCQHIDRLPVENNRHRILGEFDWDGLLLSYIGVIPHQQLVTKDEFIPRTRNDLQLVDFDGFLAVRKNYRGNFFPFVNELKCIHYLGGIGCNVPSILDVDFNSPALTISFINGITLKHEIVNQGVDILNRSFQLLYGISPRDKRARDFVIKKVYQVLNNIIDSQFVCQLSEEVKKIHTLGIILNDVKYGNIVIEQDLNKPFLIDFEMSRRYPHLPRLFLKKLLREDIRKLRNCFGENFPEYFCDSSDTVGI